MIVGILKEIKPGEKRVSLIPSDCTSLIRNGVKVVVEKGAGAEAGFPDVEYLSVGVEVLGSAKRVYDQANLLLKVKEPQPSELPFFRPDHTLFCYLHLGGNPTLCEQLQKIGLTAYAFETVSVNGTTPCLAPMSAIAGRLAVQIGTRLLHSVYGGKGTLLGGTSFGTEGSVVVLGAGVAGFESAKLAFLMGAQVHLLDINQNTLAACEQRLPGIITQLSSPKALQELLPTTDLLIGAVYLLGKTAVKVVDQRQMSLMPAGSVAVDISIDQGGCFETSRPCTHQEPSYLVGQVIHSAVTNLPAAVPRSASISLSKAIRPYVLELATGAVSAGLQRGKNLQAGELLIEL